VSVYETLQTSFHTAGAERRSCNFVSNSSDGTIEILFSMTALYLQIKYAILGLISFCIFLQINVPYKKFSYGIFYTKLFHY